MLPQVFLFIVVGALTTIIDFVMFNLLTGTRLGWRRIPANIVSVTAAMTWSFLANWFIVFAPDGNEWMQRAARFLVTTAFSAFVLQNVVLYLASYVWKRPVNAAVFMIRKLRFGGRFGDDAISRNLCKTLAVSAGLVWNFLWYKFFVYAI
jgi:putative flippase GtrA